MEAAVKSVPPNGEGRTQSSRGLAPGEGAPAGRVLCEGPAVSAASRPPAFGPRQLSRLSVWASPPSPSPPQFHARPRAGFSCSRSRRGCEFSRCDSSLVERRPFLPSSRRRHRR